MMNSTMPGTGLRPVDVRCAGTWLLRHGLGDGPPTPLLTARLAVRRRARLLGSVLHAVLILGAALVQVSDRLATRESTAPTILWSLPVVLLFGSAPGWWNAASIGFVVLGLAAYIAVQARTPCAAAMARHVVGVR